MQSLPELRFRPAGDTVLDTATGLTWLADGSTPDLPGMKGGRKPWSGPFTEPPHELPPLRTGCYGPIADYRFDDTYTRYPAFDYIDRLNEIRHASHDDWRLPNVNELATLINAAVPHNHLWLMQPGVGFRNLETHANFWTSTTSFSHPNEAWHVHFTNSANVHTSSKIWCAHYILPVRGINTGPLKVHQTGQTTCYSADVNPVVIESSGRGQDGDLRHGVPWPTDRFVKTTTIGGQAAIKDTMTSLTWLASPSAEKVRWDDAKAYLPSAQWRLPSREEIRSLAHYGRADLLGWLTGFGFDNIHATDYWTADLCANSHDYVWSFGLGWGLYGRERDRFEAMVWPVHVA